MKKWIGLSIVLLALPFSANAQQTITIEQEKIKGELDFPQLTVVGKRQTPQFPASTIDLKPKELLARVPRKLIAPEPLERVPVNSIDVKLRKSVAK